MSYVPVVFLRKGFDTGVNATSFAPRLFFKTALSLIIFTMASCGGGGGSGTPADSTPPVVISTSPADGGADVAVNAAISVVFSEPMDELTVKANGGFTLQANGGAVTGSIAYNPETQTALFWPNGGLGYRTSYTATVTTGVTDVAGNALASDYSWSFATEDTPGNSLNPSVSEDGRYVAFEFEVAAAPGYGDVLMQDTPTGDATAGEAIIRIPFDNSVFVNVAMDGTDSGSAYKPSVSADGRYVAFWSYAGDLVADDTNGKDDVFVRDTQSGTTIRVSLANDGAEGDDHSREPSISDDGRYVAFYSVAENLVAIATSGSEIFVRDTVNNTTAHLSVNSSGVEGNGASSDPSISGDGLRVAFESDATNLVAGDTNSVRDIFLRDTQSGAPTRVSVHTSGAQSDSWSWSASISGNGRYVAFCSSATNLVNDDTNGVDDIFLRDTQSGTTTRVSVSDGGAEGDGHSRSPSISFDGRYIVFQSLATNLVARATSGWQVFLRDAQSGTTILVSATPGGTPGDDHSEDPSISADGRYIVFQSKAANLVAGDTNKLTDVFRVPNPL